MNKSESSEIAVAAAEWTVRARAGLSAAERRQLARWLLRSPAHVTEFLRVGRLDSTLRAFRGWSRLPRPDSRPDAAPRGDVVHLADFRVRGSPFPRPETRRRRPAWLAAAASVAIAAIGGLALYVDHGRHFRTEPGETREITLADGSALRLLSNSEVRVEYSRDLRALRLDHGKAFFRVEKDPARPFVVDAGSVRTRAVGTMFSVERNAEGVVVAVQEGVVDVHAPPAPAPVPDAPPPARSVALRAQERVLVDGEGIRGPVSPAAVAAAPWAPHSVEFEDTTVAEVATWFNARNHVQIEIRDARVAGRRISGVFAGNDPRSFVRFVESAGGATSLETEDRIVLRLRGRAGAAAMRSE